MPGGIEGIIQDIRARQAMKQRGQVVNDAQMNAMLRALMTQNAIQQRQANSPTAAREKRLAGQFATKREDQAAQDKAMVEAVLLLTPNEVPPEWRPRLATMQKYLAGNPSGALAKQVLTAAKPHGFQLKATPVDNGDGTISTEYTVFDPNAGSMGPVSSRGLAGASSTPATGPAVGVRPSAAAGPTSRSLGGAAEHFYGKHFGVDDGDDSGGP
jgi:hypothetical protein